MDLVKNRVVIVTGGGRGIGRATALLFAREGAAVVVNDAGASAAGAGSDPAVAEETARAIESEGGHALANTENVSTEEGSAGVLAATLERFGRVDVLVNNAGAIADRELLRTESADWERMLRDNLDSTFYCTRAVAGQMKKQGDGGRIVNTTGIAGLVGNFGQSGYAAAAAGIYGLMRTASIELQRFDIMVNAVAPLAKTRLTEHLPMFEHVDTMRPEHVAPAHLFFGSSLSGDLTGNVLAVAGGRMSVFKLTESPGQFKDDAGGIWTAEEIREHWTALAKV